VGAPELARPRDRRARRLRRGAAPLPRAGQAGAIEALLGAFGGPRGEPDPPLARIARRLAPALPEPTRVLLRLAAASRVRPAEEDDLPAAVPAPPPPADALLVERILADL
jgi:hypothetical protein